VDRQPAGARHPRAARGRLRPARAPRRQSHRGGRAVIALAVAVCAALGVHLLYAELVLGHRDRRAVPSGRRPRTDRRDWLVQAGLADVRWSEFAAITTALFVLGAVFAFVLFGGVLAAIAVGAFAASFPAASSRARRTARRAAAQDAWPRMIEEIRIQTSALGRSIPQALFEVGRRGPVELRPAFEAA